MANLNNSKFKDKKEQVKNKKFLLLEDAEHSGLERIVVDRNSFFHGEEVLKYIRGAKEIRICGIALGFFITNKSLVDIVKNILKSGGKIEFLLAHPESEIVKFRDKEEQWLNKLQEVIKTTLKGLFILKKEYPKNVRVYLFKGEIHNTTIITEKVIMINPYIFGKRGWYSPALIFSKNNQTIVSGFGEQLEEMKKYGEDNPETFIELEKELDFNNIISS